LLCPQGGDPLERPNGVKEAERSIRICLGSSDVEDFSGEVENLSNMKKRNLIYSLISGEYMGYSFNGLFFIIVDSVITWTFIAACGL